MLIYFLNYVVIQLILEFKKSFGKYDPVSPKNPFIFFGTCCIPLFMNMLVVVIQIES